MLSRSCIRNLLGGLVAACLSGCAGATTPPVLTLHDLDAQLAAQPHNASLHVTALETLAQIDGRVLGPGGEAADLGYAPLYTRTFDLVASSDQPPQLAERLASLPAPSRGARDQRIASQGQTGRLEERLTFAGNESAIVYIRSEPRVPVEVRVETTDGRELCTISRQSGRALCRWRPARDQQVLVRAWVVDGNLAARLALFTN